MGWVLCYKCHGVREVPVDPGDPDGEKKECPECKDSSYPGHVYREYMS